MIRALVLKELRQHWWAFLTLAGMALSGYLLMLGAGTMKGTTPFEALANFVKWMGVLGGAMLAHRLVVLEYRAKTQLFLESLPLARWHMLAVKYGLGLTVQTLIVGLALGLASLQTLHRGELTGTFLIIVGARALSVIWALYSFFFLTGLLGRYRVALGIGSLLGLAFLGQGTSLHLERFGPFALMDQTFAFEREQIPWLALAQTWVLALSLSALALALSLTREGSVAALLAEKMSYREKVFMAALLIGFSWALGALGEKLHKAPFDLANAAFEERPGVRVKVSTGVTQDQDAERLAAHVARELSEMREYLGLEKLPSVFISSRRDLDANRFESGTLERGEGVYVQANFASKDWRDDPFMAWLVREVLTVSSERRVLLESRRWVLDGFGLFWVSRDDATARPLTLRALYGVEKGFSVDDLHRWLTFTERVGSDVAEGVAWSGLRSLSRHQGAQHCQELLRTALAKPEAKDIRVLFQRGPLDRELHSDFFADWQSDLAEARQQLAQQLDSLPRVSGEVSFVPLSETSRRVHLRARIDPPISGSYQFLYQQLPPFDEVVLDKALLRLENSYADRPEDDLSATYSRGSRLLWTFAVPVPALGCRVISGWNRQEIP